MAPARRRDARMSDYETDKVTPEQNPTRPISVVRITVEFSPGKGISSYG